MDSLYSSRAAPCAATGSWMSCELKLKAIRKLQVAPWSWLEISRTCAVYSSCCHEHGGRLAVTDLRGGLAGSQSSRTVDVFGVVAG